MNHCQALNWSTIQSCSISETYIRPDDGITVLPWLYSAIVFGLHLPLVLVRVLKWEAGQVWSLAMAAFSITLISLAYKSTGWAPEQIYTWMPLTLVVDVGAVVQVFVLIVEEGEGARAINQGEVRPDGHRIYRFLGRCYNRAFGWIRRRREEVVNSPATRERGFSTNGYANGTSPVHRESVSSSPANTNYSSTRQVRESVPLLHLPPPHRGPPSTTSESPLQDIYRPGSNNSRRTIPTQIRPVGSLGYQHEMPSKAMDQAAGGVAGQSSRLGDAWAFISSKTFLLLALSVLLFFGLIGLQITGLVYATRGTRFNGTLNASYCSPAFQLGNQVYDLACQSYSIDPNFRGTGCVNIAGDQSTWLSGTRSVLISQLIAEFLDVLLLILVKSTQKWREVKMKRPWFSLFFGVAVLSFMVSIGVYQAGNSPLPHENGQSMPVLVNGTFEGLCRSQVFPGGLRGTIIAWSDAVFKGWGDLYSMTSAVASGAQGS